MYRRILLADDGSELARAAIPHAVAMATAASAGVLVLRISHAAGPEPETLGPESWDERVRLTAPTVPPSDEDRLEAYPPLSEAETALREAGVRAVGTLVVRGEPGPAIVSVASRLECDLIVMSTHGLSGLKRAVLGSVADYVVHNAPDIAVLLCANENR